MICPACSKNLPETDFYPHQIECFKCVYKKKTVSLKKKPDKKCPICNLSIYSKYRLVYCSEECSKIGYNKVRQDRWGINYVGNAGIF